MRCSQLEDEVAAAYSDLAASSFAPSQVAGIWAEFGRREKRRAGLLRALAELSLALDDDGPFLVQVRGQLAELRKVVDSVQRRISSTLDAPTARLCAEALEAASQSELHAGLLELAEPEVRRILRLIDAEAKSLRRGDADGGRTRRAGRQRNTCASAF